MTTSSTPQPCGIFWDIENIDVPKRCSAKDIVQLFRQHIIQSNALNEREFYCVCDVRGFPTSTGISLESVGVTIVQVYNYTKNAADKKIIGLIEKFINDWGSNGCTIVVVTGDSDFLAPLQLMKLNNDLTVYLVHLSCSYSPELLWCADRSYQLDGNLLVETSPTKIFRTLRKEVKFIKLTGFPENTLDHNLINDVNQIISNSLIGGRIVRIAKKTLWIGLSDPSKLIGDEFLSKFTNITYKDNKLKATLVENIFFDQTGSEDAKSISFGDFNRIVNSWLSETCDNQQMQKQTNFLKEEDKSCFVQVTGYPISNFTRWDFTVYLFGEIVQFGVMKIIHGDGSSIWIKFVNEQNALEAVSLINSIKKEGKTLKSSLIKSPPPDIIALSKSSPSLPWNFMNQQLDLKFLKITLNGSSSEAEIIISLKEVCNAYRAIFVKPACEAIWVAFPSKRPLREVIQLNNLVDGISSYHLENTAPITMLRAVDLTDLVANYQNIAIESFQIVNTFKGGSLNDNRLKKTNSDPIKSDLTVNHRSTYYIQITVHQKGDEKRKLRTFIGGLQNILLPRNVHFKCIREDALYFQANEWDSCLEAIGKINSIRLHGSRLEAVLTDDPPPPPKREQTAKLSQPNSHLSPKNKRLEFVQIYGGLSEAESLSIYEELKNLVKSMDGMFVKWRKKIFWAGFNSKEKAEAAISKLNGSTIGHIHLRATYGLHAPKDLLSSLKKEDFIKERSIENLTAKRIDDNKLYIAITGYPLTVKKKDLLGNLRGLCQLYNLRFYRSSEKSCIFLADDEQIANKAVTQLSGHRLFGSKLEIALVNNATSLPSSFLSTRNVSLVKQNIPSTIVPKFGGFLRITSSNGQYELIKTQIKNYVQPLGAKFIKSDSKAIWVGFETETEARTSVPILNGQKIQEIVLIVVFANGAPKTLLLSLQNEDYISKEEKDSPNLSKTNNGNQPKVSYTDLISSFPRISYKNKELKEDVKVTNTLVNCNGFIKIPWLDFSQPFSFRTVIQSLGAMFIKKDSGAVWIGFSTEDEASYALKVLKANSYNQNILQASLTTQIPKTVISNLEICDLFPLNNQKRLSSSQINKNGQAGIISQAPSTQRIAVVDPQTKPWSPSKTASKSTINHPLQDQGSKEPQQNISPRYSSMSNDINFRTSSNTASQPSKNINDFFKKHFPTTANLNNTNRVFVEITGFPLFKAKSLADSIIFHFYSDEVQLYRILERSIWLQTKDEFLAANVIAICSKGILGYKLNAVKYTGMCPPSQVGMQLPDYLNRNKPMTTIPVGTEAGTNPSSTVKSKPKKKTCLIS